ncbi:hypothetical protein LCGC14_1957650, partial [marine sediment metagenome]
MKKQSQSSIWDSLIEIMPEFADKIKKSPNYVDPIAAKSLYNIWRAGEKKEEKNFKKPVTLGHEEQRRMADAGLITVIGDNIEITEKGSKIINVMILGDERSIFEDDGTNVDYNKALNNTKGVKTAKR